jgi:ABC-type dipeptide/oligopeptide/nickel transport system permease subunit
MLAGADGGGEPARRSPYCWVPRVSSFRQPPAADWGLMISNGRSFVDKAPWISLAPGIAMSITVIGISLLGDGLREVLDPRLSGRR